MGEMIRLTADNVPMQCYTALPAGAGLHHVFRAATSWYGGGSLNARGRPGPSPYDRMSGITCPVLGFFGQLDKNPSPEHMAMFDAKLSEGGVPHEFHAYDGADHGF